MLMHRVQCLVLEAQGFVMSKYEKLNCFNTFHLEF